eukprot:COSAG02_NODE_7512_length_2977_cov_16.470466_2_plen_74_part_00
MVLTVTRKKSYQELRGQGVARSLVLLEKCCTVLTVCSRKFVSDDLAAKIDQIKFVTRNCAKFVRGFQQQCPKR